MRSRARPWFRNVPVWLRPHWAAREYPPVPIGLAVRVGPPCTYDPRVMAGEPIGMFHCPECGEMVLAGVAHPDYWNLGQNLKAEP